MFVTIPRRHTSWYLILSDNSSDGRRIIEIDIDDNVKRPVHKIGT